MPQHFKNLSSLQTSIFKTFNKKKLTSPLPLGLALLCSYYLLTLENTLADFTVVVVVFVSVFISIIENCLFYEFFMYHYDTCLRYFREDSIEMSCCFPKQLK